MKFSISPYTAYPLSGLEPGYPAMGQLKTRYILIDKQNWTQGICIYPNSAPHLLLALCRQESDKVAQ